VGRKHWPRSIRECHDAASGLVPMSRTDRRRALTPGGDYSSCSAYPSQNPSPSFRAGKRSVYQYSHSMSDMSSDSRCCARAGRGVELWLWGGGGRQAARMISSIGALRRYPTRIPAYSCSVTYPVPSGTGRTAHLRRQSRHRAQRAGVELIERAQGAQVAARLRPDDERTLEVVQNVCRCRWPSRWGRHRGRCCVRRAHAGGGLGHQVRHQLDPSDLRE
jgi:hypothetical protein